MSNEINNNANPETKQKESKKGSYTKNIGPYILSKIFLIKYR